MEIEKRLDAQDELLKNIYKSAEKTRKYFLWTLIITLIMFFLPLLGIIFILPSFINTYLSALGGI